MHCAKFKWATRWKTLQALMFVASLVLGALTGICSSRIYLIPDLQPVIICAHNVIHAS